MNSIQNHQCGTAKHSKAHSSIMAHIECEHRITKIVLIVESTGISNFISNYISYTELNIVSFDSKIFNLRIDKKNNLSLIQAEILMKND